MNITNNNFNLFFPFISVVCLALASKEEGMILFIPKVLISLQIFKHQNFKSNYKCLFYCILP